MSHLVDRFRGLEESLEKLKALSVSIINPIDIPGIKVGIVKCDGYSISEFVADSGSILEKHSHAQTEIIVVLEGSMLIEFAQDSHILDKHDSIIIHKGIEHKITYKEPGRALSIMAPVERVERVKNG